MESGEVAGWPDPVGAGLLVGAIDDPLEKVAVGSDSRSVVREKPGKGGKDWKGAGLLGPFGDAGSFEQGHEDKGPEHLGGIARGAAFYRRIEALEELYGRIKVELRQDDEFFGVVFQG